MKIASDARKLFLSSSSALVLSVLIGAGYSAAYAAQTAPMTPPPLAPLPGINENSALVTLPPPLPVNNGPIGLANGRRSLNPLEDKVSDSIKSVVRQMGTIDNVSLDDLNTARQAVAKLDVLIEIEKRLAELDKIHNEHGNERSLASAIPASALSAPPMPMVMPKMPAENFSPPPVNRGDVTRIIGAAGHNMAVIQGKTVRVGDSLADGSTIVAISSRQVETKSKDGSLHQLKVRGVEEVFGHTL